MGNCTGYCGGCDDQGTKFDANQIRNSIKDNEHMMNNDRFGGNVPQKDNTYGDDDYTNDN